jgi:hypothetical protein
MSVTNKRGKLELYVNGLARRCYGVTTQEGTVGIQATLSVDPSEGTIDSNDAIEVSLGYIEGTHLTFTGVALSDDTTLNPWWEEVRCSGKMSKGINKRINTEDPTASGTPTTGVLPVLVDVGP